MIEEINLHGSLIVNWIWSEKSRFKRGELFWKTKVKFDIS
jgi:hypothetical protein